MKSLPQLTGSDINQVWKSLLYTCHDLGSEVNPRGMEVKELLGVSSRIDMRFPTLGVVDRKLSYRHAANEALWILRGSNLLADIAKHAPSYSQYSDDSMTLDGAYGPRVMGQMRYVVDTLRRDNCSRQAVMSIWNKNPRESRDIPCTLSLQFLLRSGKIHCMATMRSSDAWLGFPYDVFCFTMITAMVAIQLQTPLELGVLDLKVGSQHLYKKHYWSAMHCVADAKSVEFEPMTLHGLNTPDDLMNDLGCISDGLRTCKNPHLNSISRYVSENLRQ